MRGGHVDAVSRRAIAGWAADQGRPGERLVVSIFVNGVNLGDALADRLRNDLAGLGRYGDGKHGFTFAFPEPLSTDRGHVIRVVYQDSGLMLPNGEQRIDAEPTPPAPQMPAPLPRMAQPHALPGGPPHQPPAELAPILVTAPGRSGTTLMMGLLARCPAIIAAELVPYELRLISYHAAAWQVLTAPANLERSTHPDRLEGDGFHIGFNPFNSSQYNHAFANAAPLRDYFDSFAPAQLAANARILVGEYYRRLAADRGKDGARFFAEKNNNLHKQTRLFARRAFGTVREIVILRDPRDVLCSHIDYFSSPPEKAFTQLSHASRQLLAIRAEQREDVHLLKYEDMVRGDPACFAALSTFLGATISPDAGEAGQAVFRQHATSASPEASIARWRTNLSPDLRARCDTEWAEFLAAFGYAID